MWWAGLKRFSSTAPLAFVCAPSPPLFISTNWHHYPKERPPLPGSPGVGLEPLPRLKCYLGRTYLSSVVARRQTACYSAVSFPFFDLFFLLTCVIFLSLLALPSSCLLTNTYTSPSCIRINPFLIDIAYLLIDVAHH